MEGVAARLPGVSVRDPMRAAAAILVTVTRFGVWRGAVAATLALVWAVVCAWVVSHAMARGGAPPLAVDAAAATALALASVFARRLRATRPFALRWDGTCWFLSSSVSLPAAADGVPGDVAVMIDLGGWLLLRFLPERRVATAVPCWLPLQRRGLERSWHSLRCAVHAPRPARGAATDAEVD